MESCSCAREHALGGNSSQIRDRSPVWPPVNYAPASRIQKYLSLKQELVHAPVYRIRNWSKLLIRSDARAWTYYSGIRDAPYSTLADSSHTVLQCHTSAPDLNFDINRGLKRGLKSGVIFNDTSTNH